MFIFIIKQLSMYSPNYITFIFLYRYLCMYYKIDTYMVIIHNIYIYIYIYYIYLCMYYKIDTYVYGNNITVIWDTPDTRIFY